MKTLFIFLMCIMPACADPLLKAFHDPGQVIKIPLKAGLAAPKGMTVEWKNFDGEWSSQSVITTHKGKMLKVGDVDNDVSCFFSGDKNHVKYATIRARCMNADGVQITIEKFREVVELLATELGIENPKDILQNVDPVKGKVVDSDKCRISVTKLSFNIGHSWQVKIETK